MIASKVFPLEALSDVPLSSGEMVVRRIGRNGLTSLGVIIPKANEVTLREALSRPALKAWLIASLSGLRASAVKEAINQGKTEISPEIYDFLGLEEFLLSDSEENSSRVTKESMIGWLKTTLIPAILARAKETLGKELTEEQQEFVAKKYSILFVRLTKNKEILVGDDIAGIEKGITCIPEDDPMRAYCTAQLAKFRAEINDVF